MSLYQVVRLLHISAAMIFVGGLFARQAVRSLTARAPDVAAIVTLTQAAGIVERMLVIPGNLLAIVFGLLVALWSRAPILGSLQGPYRNWLVTSIVILVVLMPLVPLVFLPRGRLFEAALRDAAAAGRMTPELKECLADPVVRWAHRAEMLGVAAVVVLMVLKPF